MINYKSLYISIQEEILFSQYSSHLMTKFKRLFAIRANNMQVFLPIISADRDATDIFVILNNFNIHLIVGANIDSKFSVCSWDLTVYQAERFDSYSLFQHFVLSYLEK